MTNPCFILFVVVASEILLSQAKPTHPGAEEVFSQSVEHTLKSFRMRSGSSIETKLQSLKTGRSSSSSASAASVTTSLEAFSTRSQSKLDDQTLSNGESLAKYLSRKILLDWSVGGRKLSSFVPVQLKTVDGVELGHPYRLIRVLRSRIFKTKSWKKFGRVALDQLALRLMRKRGTEVKNKGWKKFGRVWLNDLTSRLLRKRGSPLKSKAWKKFGRVRLDELTLRLMKKRSSSKN